MNRTSVILTVDTEANIAGGIEKYDLGYRPALDQFVACNIGGRAEGLGFLIRTLRERGLRATFFVEAAQANYFGPSAMGRYVDEIMAAGQDVQLHVHPCWYTYRDGVPDPTQAVGDSCAILAEPVLEDFFSRSIETFRGWTGNRPLALRTGGFHTGRRVYRVMRHLGITLSSSICLGVRRPAEPEYQLAGEWSLIEGVREYPATAFRDARGSGNARWRPLQIRSCSSVELIALLDAAYAAEYGTVVIVTHPFEYVKPATRRNCNAWTNAILNRNRIVRARLRRLCDYLAANDDRFEVCTFAELGSRALASPRPAPVLHGSPLRSWLRSLENGLSDHLTWL